MTDPALIEAAARALLERGAWNPYYSEQMATAVLTAVTPLIEAAALERAAKAAEGWDNSTAKGNWIIPAYSIDIVSTEIATAIRALKEQP